MHVVVDAPRPLVGFAVLCILVANAPGIDPFALWCVYSVVYWACGLPAEDNFVLLAATTLFFAGADLAEEWLPNSVLNRHRDALTLALKLVSVLPVSCNNVLFHPGWGAMRAAFYLAVLSAKKREAISALFSKSESLAVLLCWHVAVAAAASRFRPPSPDDAELLPAAATQHSVAIDMPKRGGGGR